jgi:nucleotide-binding universal stress UspA family protein
VKNSGFSRILLATDGSDESQAATAAAATFARDAGAVVRVVHVWNLELKHRHGAWDMELRSDAEALIHETVGRLRAQGIEAEGAICRSDNDHIAAAVAEAARQFAADLIVVGSRGLTNWQALLRHSVSHQVLSNVDCPVLIVRAMPDPARDERRVLLAVAGGDDVEPATRAAIAAAAGAPGSRVLVLHVPLDVRAAQGFAYVERDEEVQGTLDRALLMLREAGVAAESMVPAPDSVGRAVADTAAAWHADVIVIESARLTDLGGMLFASVTHDLLHLTKTPVLVAERVAT